MRELLCIALIVLPFTSVSEKLEGVIDNHLCKNTLSLILPTSAGRMNHVNSELVVNALVELDSTLGITPCQFRRIQGYPSHPDDGGVNLAIPGKIEVPENPNADAIKKMYSSSGSGSYGSSDNSEAYRAGKMVGGTLKDTSRLASVGFDNTIRGIRSLGVDLPDVRLDIDGKWINKAGEVVGDIGVESFKATTKFFSGVAAGLGPSVAGRRRVVYDTDCDMVEHEVDSMESHCAKYRYDRLAHLFPTIRDMNIAESRIMSNRTRLNNTVAGDPMSFTPGMWEVMSDQRDALYGENGTCTHPTRGSVAYIGNKLIEAVFKTNDAAQGVFDTHWANLDIVDKSMKNITAEMSSKFSESILEGFNISLAAQAALSAKNHLKLDDAFLESQALLASTSDASNTRQAAFEEKLGSASERAEKLLDTVKKYLARASKKLDDTTNMLDSSPTGLSRFTDIIDDGGRDLFISANRSVETLARDVVSNSLRPNAKKLVDQFKSQSESSLGGTDKDWAGSLAGYINDFNRVYRSRDSELKSASVRIAQEFDSANADTVTNLTDMQASQNERFGSSQSAWKDVARSGQVLQSNARVTKSAVLDLLNALISSNANTVSDLQTKLSHILSLASGAAGDQLSASTEQVGRLNGAVAETNTNMNAVLAELEARARSAIGEALMKSSQTSADDQESLRSVSDVNGAKLASTEEAQNSVSKSSSTDWMKRLDDGADDLNSVVSQAELERYANQQDTLSAISAGAAVSLSVVSDTKADASGSAGSTRRNLVAAGSAVDNISTSAESELRAQSDAISGNSDSISNLSRSVVSSKGQSDSVSADLFRSLSEADSQAASAFSASSRSTANAAGSLMDNSVTNIEASQSKQISELESKLSQESHIDISGVKRRLASATAFGDSANSELAQIESSLDALPKMDSETFEKERASQEMESSIATSANKVGQVVADSLSRAESVQSEITSRIDASLKKSDSDPQMKSLMSKADSANADGGDAISKRLEGENLIHSILQTIGVAIAASQEKIGDVSVSLGGWKENIRRNTSVLSTMLMDSNSSLTSELANIISQAGAYSSRFPDIVSKGVEAYIDELETDGLRLMNVIGDSRGTGIMRLAGDLSSESIDILRQAGEATSEIANRLESGGDSSEDAGAGLQSVSTEISRAQKYLLDNKDQAVSYQDYLDSNLRDVSRDTGRLSSQLIASVKSTNSSLRLLAERSGSESSFASQINDAQSRSLVSTVGASVNQTSQIAAEADVAAQSSIASSSSVLENLERSMQQEQLRLKQEIQETMGSVSNAEAAFSANVSSDKSQVSLQLMMARRAVSSLLRSWNKYVEVETQKFTRMNATDYEYISSVQNRINSANDTAGVALRTSQTNMASLNANILEGLRDYLNFQHRMESGIAGYKHGLGLMNVSTNAGLAQVKEMIFNMNANDEFLDHQQRDDMTDAISKFNKELDRRASEAQASIT